MSGQIESWIEVSIPVNDRIEEAIANFLFELGAQGNYCQENILRAYFRDSAWNKQKHEQFQRYLQQLIELHFPVVIDRVGVRKIENQEWNERWKQSLQPIEIDDKILIKPSWIDVEVKPSLKVIQIDPQMAFGTGTHETTQLMIKLLIRYIGSSQQILDIGTGTGILAITAALLSNATIIAFDNDPIAVFTAQQNCMNNRIRDRIQLFCGTIDALKANQFDLILANINRAIIVESFSEIYRCLESAGRVMLSGILLEEKNKFLNSLDQFHFNIIDEQQQGEWVGLVVEK